MQIKKRDGSLESVDFNKILKSITRFSEKITDIDPVKVAQKIVNGIYDGISTHQIDHLAVQTSASLIADEPNYSYLAARLLCKCIEKESNSASSGIYSFSQSMQIAYELGLINERLSQFVKKNSRKLNDAIKSERNDLFEYFGLKTLYDRYLLKHPKTRLVIETPQYLFMRVACAISENIKEAIEYYQIFSLFEYIPSTPTLFNAGTKHEQLSSCYLLDSPMDSLESIYDRYKQMALLSKYSGGLGLSYHRVRSFGSLIKGTNGASNGIIPWLKTLDSSVSAVNQGGRRKGACCVYLETWHADIESFLELRDNTGDEARRTHNLNLSHWIPDLFMKRVEEDADWSLFDPALVPEFTDLFGEDFEKAYLEAEKSSKFVKQVKARDLYGKMMRTLAQTGNGWMCFKDSSNKKSNQTLTAEHVVHSSNLCTEIIEVTNDNQIAVCNLGSINLSKYVKQGTIDWGKLSKNVKLAIRQLDRVIDLNFYPVMEAKSSNAQWRPIGLGIMGLQDVFFQLHLPFDGEQARQLSVKIQERIYFDALQASNDLAIEKGVHPLFNKTFASINKLQFDLWGVEKQQLSADLAWDELREKIKQHGLRNSLMIAIAPTATIASIVGCYECIEPQISNLFKRESLSGDFLQINKYLVEDLKKEGLWSEEVKNQLRIGNGSIQHIGEIPEYLKLIYRTVWEIPMRSLIDMAADRGVFIDQSQSLNLFMGNPSIGTMSSMYMYAWKRGLKTTYYLRSRPATQIAKVNVAQSLLIDSTKAVACSLENPETCESCQ